MHLLHVLKYSKCIRKLGLITFIATKQNDVIVIKSKRLLDIIDFR